jgi:hypothetical protein
MPGFRAPDSDVSMFFTRSPPRHGIGRIIVSTNDFCGRGKTARVRVRCGGGRLVFATAKDYAVPTAS